MRSSRGALLEASLVDLGLEQMRGCDNCLSHDGFFFFEDLSNMGPHLDGSDILELRLVLALVLR